MLHTISKRSDLRDVQQLRCVEDLLAKQASRVDENQVLFMKGHPDLEWLCEIGAMYDVDPDFFVQHFANAGQFGWAQNYSLPLLASPGTNTMCLTVSNLGFWDTHKSYASLNAVRQHCDREIEQYWSDWNRNRGIRPCDSLVRSFQLHDKQNFFLEQKISISLQKSAQGAWTCELGRPISSGDMYTNRTQ